MGIVYSKIAHFRDYFDSRGEREEERKREREIQIIIVYIFHLSILYVRAFIYIYYIRFLFTDLFVHWIRLFGFQIFFFCSFDCLLAFLICLRACICMPVN